MGAKNTLEEINYLNFIPFLSFYTQIDYKRATC